MDDVFYYRQLDELLEIFKILKKQKNQVLIIHQPEYTAKLEIYKEVVKVRSSTMEKGFFVVDVKKNNGQTHHLLLTYNNVFIPFHETVNKKLQVWEYEANDDGYYEWSMKYPGCLN